MAYVTIAEKNFQTTMVVLGIGVFLGFLVGLVGPVIIEKKYFPQPTPKEILFQEFEANKVENMTKGLREEFKEWQKENSVRKQIKDLDTKSTKWKFLHYPFF